MHIRKKLKKLPAALAAALLFGSSVATAAPWALVANSGNTSSGPVPASVSTIDLGVSPPKVYGPHLAGRLDPDPHNLGNGLFDAAVSAKGSFALVSSFGNRVIYRLDLRDRTAPTLAASIHIPDMFPEDISIAPNGSWAVVSDGGFSQMLYFIDLATNQATKYDMTSAALNAQAVSITPDGHSVVFVDYFGKKVTVGKVNNAHTGLTSTSTANLPDGAVNVAVSFDGSMALVAALTWGSNAEIRFRIIPVSLTLTGPVAGTPLVLPAGPQTVAFSRTRGDRAYALLSGITSDVTPLSVPGHVPTEAGRTNAAKAVTTTPSRLVELAIDGTSVSLTGRSVTLSSLGTSQLFGVDTLALSVDGKSAIASNTTMSGATAEVFSINLETFTATRIQLNPDIPAGVSFIPPAEPIPTLSQWAMGLLASLLLGIGAWRRRGTGEMR